MYTHAYAHTPHACITHTHTHACTHTHHMHASHTHTHMHAHTHHMHASHTHTHMHAHTHTTCMHHTHTHTTCMHHIHTRTCMHTHTPHACITCMPTHACPHMHAHTPPGREGEHVVLCELHDMDLGDAVGEIVVAQLRALQSCHQARHKLVQECDLKKESSTSQLIVGGRGDTPPSR